MGADLMRLPATDARTSWAGPLYDGLAAGSLCHVTLTAGLCWECMNLLPMQRTHKLELHRRGRAAFYA